MLHLRKKRGHIAALPPNNGHLSSMATFLCPQGGRYGEVQLHLYDKGVITSG